ncbi:histone, partial [Burkholderia multivorans]
MNDMLTDIEALQAQLREVNARLAEVKRDEKRAALDAIREQVALYGIS